MAEEAARYSPGKAVVGRLGMGGVGDHAVVTGLGRLVSDDDWALIGSTGALRHTLLLTGLHLAHALLCLAHVVSLRGLFSLASY